MLSHFPSSEKPHLLKWYIIYGWTMIHTLKDNGIVLLEILKLKPLNAIGFLLYGKLLHLCPRKTVILFGTFGHLDDCSIHQSLANRNYVKSLLLMNGYPLKRKFNVMVMIEIDTFLMHF